MRILWIVKVRCQRMKKSFEYLLSTEKYGCVAVQSSFRSSPLVLNLYVVNLSVNSFAKLLQVGTNAKIKSEDKFK
jgi:hypothetical protein